MTDSALHELVHKLIANGQLPVNNAYGLYASYGTGEVCDACGKSMPEPAVVYEINVGTGSAAKEFALHLKCYEVWRAERERFPVKEAAS
jgi:hypothetical protein